MKNLDFKSITHILPILLMPCLLLPCLLLLSSCSEEKQKVLKLAHGLDQQHAVHLAMEFMATRLHELSAGTMRIDIYPSAQLGSERDMIELLQIGSLAMTKVSASPMEGFVPRMKIFSLPYVFRDHQHFWSVLESDIGKKLLLEGEDFRLRGLAYYDAGSRSFYTRNTPIHTADDLKRLKIRVQKSQTAVAMVESLGGSATPISWGELYTALQQGVVDGAENNPPSFYASRHFEVSQYFSLDEHSYVPDILIMSTAIWQGLSVQQQQWLQQAADESVVFQRELWQKKSQEALAAVKEAGVNIIYPDKTSFQQAAQVMYEEIEDPAVRKLLQDIKAMP